jgi:preprotein translocase subunit SecA
MENIKREITIIVYRLRDTVFTAETLTEYAKVLGEQILAKVEQWIPNESVYQLSELMTMMKFCNLSLEVDLTTLPTEKSIRNSKILS